MVKKQTKLWTQGDGKKIRVCDMSDQHLNNAIQLLEDRMENPPNQMFGSWGWCGDNMDLDFIDDDFDMTFYKKSIETMEKEARRRKGVLKKMKENPWD